MKADDLDPDQVIQELYDTTVEQLGKSDWLYLNTQCKDLTIRQRLRIAQDLLKDRNEMRKWQQGVCGR